MSSAVVEMTETEMHALVRKLDALSDALPDPNDASSPNARAKAIADRRRVQGARDCFAAAFRLLAMRQRGHETAVVRLKSTQRALKVAAAALDADVRAGRVAPADRRHQTLMIGESERHVLAAQVAVEHALAVVADRLVALHEARSRFVLAFGDVEAVSTIA